MRNARLLGALLLLSLAWPPTMVSWARGKPPKESKMKDYKAGDLTFQVAEAGVEVKEVGVNAYEAALLDGAGQRGPWVTLVTMSAAELKELPADGHLAHFKTVYLGTMKPGEKKTTRELLGHPVSGDWQQAKIPKALTLEAYEAARPDGGAVFVGLRCPEGFDAARAEAFFKAVTRTLRVAAGKQG